MRWPYLLTGALALLGCDSIVALGGECAPLGQACREVRDPVIPRADASDDLDGDGTVDPPVLEDAGSWPGSDPDAAWPVGDAWAGLSDGGVDFPSLGNLSFELQNGSSPGDFGATGPLSNTDISPWYNCQLPGFSFLRVEEQASEVLPNDGGSFLVFQYPYVADLPVPVFQTLEQPLRKGQTYGFAVDVRAEGLGADSSVALGVFGGTVRCSAAYSLASTDYLPSGQWERRCLRFTPTQDMSELALMPIVKGVIAVTFRFYVDNIRPDPSCQ